MKKPPKRSRRLSSLFFASCLIIPAPLSQAEDRIWQGAASDAQWTNTANWVAEEVPTLFDRAIFKQGTGGETIVISDAAQAQSLQIHRGKHLTLSFEGDGTLTTTNQNNIGVSDSGSGAASLTLQRAAGSTGILILNLSPIYVGINANSADGNSLLVTGSGLQVDMTGQTNGSLVVGAAKANNSVTVSNGAQMKIKAGNIAQSASITGNSILITGENSLLTTQGTFTIGSLTAGTDYATGRNNNQLHLADGGNFVFTSTTATLSVGSIEGAHSNSILIEGNQSLLKTSGAILIGDSNSLNLGGNRLEIRDHGQLETSANVTVHGYQSDASQHDDANRLLIDQTASFTQSSGILEVNNGALLRLEAGGILAGASIHINGGRFEAAGAGFSASQTTEIGAEGILAIGSEGLNTPSTLSISSTIHFAASSVLELRIFGQNLADQAIFTDDGFFSIEEGSILRITLHDYTAQQGDFWTLFDGSTSDILGSFSAFELATLDSGLFWDTSKFNDTGGWQLRVIPEPSTAWLIIAGIIGGGGAVMIRRRR